MLPDVPAENENVCPGSKDDLVTRMARIGRPLIPVKPPSPTRHHATTSINSPSFPVMFHVYMLAILNDRQRSSELQEMVEKESGAGAANASTPNVPASTEPSSHRSNVGGAV